MRLALQHIDRIGTREDLLIVLEIASNDRPEGCLTLKQLVLSGIAPESTLKRRLSRLVRRGLVSKSPIEGDRRVQRYEIEPKAMDTLRALGRDLRRFDWA